MSKAQLVFRYEISDLFPVSLITHYKRGLGTRLLVIMHDLSAVMIHLHTLYRQSLASQQLCIV